MPVFRAAFLAAKHILREQFEKIKGMQDSCLEISVSYWKNKIEASCVILRLCIGTSAHAHTI